MKLTPAQIQILHTLAAGGTLSDWPLGNGFRCTSADQGNSFSVRHATWLKLIRARLIERIPQVYPARYCLTSAGQQITQEAPHV